MYPRYEAISYRTRFPPADVEKLFNGFPRNESISFLHDDLMASEYVPCPAAAVSISVSVSKDNPRRQSVWVSRSAGPNKHITLIKRGKIVESRDTIS